MWSNSLDASNADQAGAGVVSTNARVDCPSRQFILDLLSSQGVVTEELQNLLTWWQTNREPDEDLDLFLVRKDVFSGAAPILLELMRDGSLPTGDLHRIFGSRGRDALEKWRRANLPATSAPEVLHSEEQQEATILDLLSRDPSFPPETSQAVRYWWLADRNPGESLVVFLIRHRILSAAAPTLLELAQDQGVSIGDARRLLSSKGLTILMRSLPAIGRSSSETMNTDSTRVTQALEGNRRLDPESQTGALTGPTADSLRTPKELTASFSGRTLGQLRLIGRLQQEDQATLYEAEDLTLGRRVRVKLLTLQRTGGDEAALTRFLEGARLLSRLDHPNCLGIYAICQEPDLVYYSMPAAPGVASREVLRSKGPMSLLEATRICLQIAEGLAAAHAIGIVHGHLQLECIYVDTRGQVKIGDFSRATTLSGKLEAESGLVESKTRDISQVIKILRQLVAPDQDEIVSHERIAGADLDRLQATAVTQLALPSGCSDLLNRVTSEGENRIRTAEELAAALRNLEVRLVSAPPTPGNSPAESIVTKVERPLNLEVGSVLGKCLLLEKLGQGAVGVVFRAMHRTLNIPVAVKLFRQQALESNPSMHAQFCSEARLLAQLNHPNVVRVWDCEDNPEFFYLVLEYIDGLSLAELISQSGRLQVNRAIDIMLQAAQGLGAAQAIGVVHRDVKSANILLTRTGTVKIADLGLAVVMNTTGSSSVSGQTSGPVGTAAYISPEQAVESSHVDHRADIYSLGVTFYEMLTGRLPFQGRSPMEVIMKHMKDVPPPPTNLAPELPEGVCAILQKMLAKKPGERFQTYGELIEALGAAKGEKGTSESGIVRALALDQTKSSDSQTQTLKRNWPLWGRLFGKREG